jgi:hypothetical protein
VDDRQSKIVKHVISQAYFLFGKQLLHDQTVNVKILPDQDQVFLVNAKSYLSKIENSHVMQKR